MRTKRRFLALQSLERRQLLAASLHNAILPVDTNSDGVVSAVDALAVINHLSRQQGDSGVGRESVEAPEAEQMKLDVNNDSVVSAIDALMIVNHIARSAEGAEPIADVFTSVKAPDVGGQFNAVLNQAEELGVQNLLATSDVETLLDRASQATRSDDAIIAVVDRAGRIVGVRVEDGVTIPRDANGSYDKEILSFAIDGAVAKARTAAFFSSNAAPLTSRTIRFISQSTITQREVESSPLNANDSYRGPGLVAPIGVGGHFPPEIAFAPQVDLFAIEHQSRDSRTHPGMDGEKGTADDFELTSRFNADPMFVPETAEAFFKTFPESYGEQSGLAPNSTPRGIATLPGGIPLFKAVTDAVGNAVTGPLSSQINLVGGIGVFFPGEDGFATHEQGFKHQSENGGRVQSEKQRTNAPRILEAEFAALIAAAGGGMMGPSAFVRDLRQFNSSLPSLPNFVLPTGRIDLVGITLEIYGPTPDRSHRIPGIDRLIQVGAQIGRGVSSGDNQVLNANQETLLAGQAVPEEWLVAPKDSPSESGLTAEQVERIIRGGIAEANRTRAAIRLDIDNGFRPGAKTRMVLAVADTNGELLGLYRMPDATIFSIDVSVAKARNTAYYADAEDLQDADRVDFDGDGNFEGSGDSYPLGTALTNRSFRFLVEPRFPTGSGTPANVAPQSGLRLPGINPATAENLVNESPLVFDVYASSDHASTVMFDSFNVMRNFRDPGDDSVKLAGTDKHEPLANQNGVVFFPGSTPIYVDGRTRLAGGFGVSGDGVDQDDVVTAAGQVGFDPMQSIRVDSFKIGGVRVPFQKFNRNPIGT
ncbi:Dockerin type I repeat protein [Rubripirellula obstinata]|uniref:Dockerin type I repeat protein n=1 Tax=Rubripirellula obstinata TaxID=406547 RepID=A0A5B1CP72_9BACT|nr:dockerin type I domain-containing protein [Rubripirellula obstinata]KAA1261745.1 Dockerin type I repeat protein [Rubripirellula obstinata]